MKISADKALKYRLYFPILLVFSATMLIYGFAVNDNLSDIWIGAGIFGLIVYILLVIKRPHYFSIETTHNKIIIKFYNPQPFFTKFKSMQIPISLFYGYEIKERLGGYIKLFKVKVKSKGKIAEYKDLSISLLNKDEIKELKKELDTIIKMNKFK